MKTNSTMQSILGKEVRKSFLPKKLLLINRDFQYRYIKVSIVIGLVSTIFTAILILYPLYYFKILRIPRFLPWPILSGIGLAVLLNIFSISFLSLMISHKIAGPMYAVCRRLRLAQRGQWAGQLKLRKKDELEYVVRNINYFFEYLTNLTQKQTEDLDKIIKNLQSDQNKQEALAALKVMNEEMKNRISTHKG